MRVRYAATAVIAAVAFIATLSFGAYGCITRIPEKAAAHAFDTWPEFVISYLPVAMPVTLATTLVAWLIQKQKWSVPLLLAIASPLVILAGWFYSYSGNWMIYSNTERPFYVRGESDLSRPH